MELKVRESEHSQVFTKRGSFVRWPAQWTVIERRGTEDDDSFTLNAPRGGLWRWKSRQILTNAMR